MNNDIIRLLNLEDINVDFEKSDVIKINNVLYCNIVLTTINEHCPECGSTEYSIKDYQSKTVNHSISTASPCIIKYKARRYKCKHCNKIFYDDYYANETGAPPFVQKCPILLYQVST